jgi:hypothetical protein
MGELLLGISAGLVVSMINKYILSGTVWNWCRHRCEDGHADCDDLSSQSSAVSMDVHIHH